MKHTLLAYSLFLMLPLMGQNAILGTVTDENGIPVPYAAVCSKAGKGVMCDPQGHFQLPYTEGMPDYILVSALGFKSDTLLIAANNANYCLAKANYSIGEINVLQQHSIQSKSTVSAITVNQKQIQTTRPRNVAEALQEEVGFTNKQAYQSPLTLRGMSGKRLLVLRNGTRRFSSYPSGFMSHTINVYDLEKIEVEKGAASVQYGSGAMAGIINLIDKSPFKQEGFNARLTAGYGSVNSESNLLACAGWSDGKFAIKSGIRYRDADNFRYPDGSIAENSFYTDKDLFLTSGYQFSEQQRLVFNVDAHKGGPWGKPVGFNGSNYMRVQTHHENSNNYSLKYQIDSEGLFKNTEINAYYSHESRELVKKFYTAAGYMLSYTETTHFSDNYWGASMQSKLQISDVYSAIVGAETYWFTISTPVDAVDYIEEINFANRVSHNAWSQTSGVYIENRFQLAKKLTAIAGIRYNNAIINEGTAYASEEEPPKEQNKSAISGNVAVLHHFGTSYKSTIKINLARSFRMPETTELFADNFTSNGIVYANPNLLPEYSNSFDVCYRLSTKSISIEASPFLLLMSNMITKEEIGGLPGTNFTYVNIGKTRMFGGELNVRYRQNNVFTKTDNFSAQVGIAYLNGTNVTDAKNYFSEGVPLDYVPPFNLKANISYSLHISQHIKANCALRSTYYSEQTRLGEDPYATPAYYVLGGNLGVSFLKIKAKPNVNIAINNLANAEYYCYQSYLPAEGRDVRVFLTFNL
ncbi:TonB-dependent receptor [Saccharicrinis aurantiacus]|uniref:TonB-dependent receptor n=1 Tax=Saccharicrinis aurantiacus TaxID=1849719 RepID=UPI00249267A9|nr:TonB-dependent receptor [Saccharicrinis aurantiacus]